MLIVKICLLLFWNSLSKGEEARKYISPKCDYMGVNTLLDMGLEPQFENDECPSSWKWPEQKADTCICNGKYYKHGEAFITKTDNNEVSCKCHVKKGIQRIICEPDFNWLSSWEPLDMDVTCQSGKYNKYNGNQIFWPENTCLKCKCKPDFKGQFIPPFCQRASNDITFQFQKYISMQCTPYYEIYSKNENPALCSPIGFICNEDLVEISPINVVKDSNDSIMCKIDNEFYPKGTILNITYTKNYNNKNNINCTCSTPPLFTCVKDIRNGYITECGTEDIMPLPAAIENPNIDVMPQNERNER